ncbi:sperm flagellar protein 2 isoform X1 [Gadus chalcogrammus]|uniref:sperm flagellar protein 2 isoform X1 n=1 Tax=Gadus chalcogrammus TaxID=1042646 RepID=UPI0024C3BDAB|nr:sperm flagellar protein 2 isoform X1 [Gadus chalcogrammus]
MSDILCRWLNNELRLSKTVEPSTFSKDFSTGYLIGEVLFKYQLQDDFSAFIKSNISSSKEGNFSRIEPTLQLLGVPFDQNTAQALMQEKQGAATRLLYQLYVLLQHRKMKRTPMDTVRPTAGGPHLHKKENDVVSDHRVGPVGKRDAEVTLHKLSQRYEEQGRQQKEKSEMAELLQEQKKLLDTEDMRLKDMEKLRSSRRRQTELMARIQASIVHVPKPSAIKLVQKQHQQLQLRREQQRQQVTAEIARFEKSRKAFLTSDFSYFSSGKTLTGSRKAIGQNAPGEGGPELVLQSNSQYVQKIRQRLAEDSASCQQREKRRTRFLQEQLKAQENQQDAQRDEQLVHRLTRQTEQERRLVAQLLQVRAQKEVLRENRLFREQQYQEQRERDFLEALEREATLAQQAQLDEADEVSRQMELHNRMAAERAQHRHKKHSNLCREVLDQIEDLATKVGEYRLLTGKLIPVKMMREWKELLLLGLPLYDPVPGDSEPGPLSAPLDPVERQKEELLNNQDYQEYTNMEGEWAWPEEAGEAKRHLGSNNILDHVVLRLKNMVNEPRPATPPPLFPQFTLKACVLGQPCSGKTTCLAQLAQEHGIHIISPDTLIQEALAAYQSGEKVSDGGEIPTVRDGEDEVPEGEGRSFTSLETKESNSLSALDQQQEMSKREPSARAQRGAVIDQVLRTGKAIPDELLVNIIVETIRLVPDTSGWVLDGFPVNVAQARMLELALGGSTSVPIEKKPPRRGSNKQKAPQALEPIAAKKLPVLDLVLLLDTPESVLLNRAVRQSRGRGERVLRSAEVNAPSPTVRSASLTIKEEHVESRSLGAAPTAPPDGHPDPGGTAPALDGCTDRGLGGRQIQHSIASFQDNWSKLEKWYSGNQGILVRLDANVSEEELFSSLESVLLQAVMNKPKVLDMGETPGSNPPGTAPHQDPKLERPGSACIIRPRSSAKSPRGRTRAASLCGADRELGSALDGDPPRPGSARWIYVDEALPVEVPGALLSYWESISESYMRNIKAVMQNLRIERNIIIRHLFNIREEYKHYLSRPELNQEFVSQWQQDFNSSIPEDMRADTETKTELHQRLDDLRERLWDMSDKRREEDSQEKNSLVENGWLEDHKAFLINHFATLIQVELDRFQDTLSVLRDYYLGMCRQGTPPFPPTHFTCLPLVAATDCRDTAPVQGDSTDHAAQGARETEEDTVLQWKAQVIPLLDRSAVAPEPSVDGDLQKGARDKNSHGKHISDVYKQALDAIKNLCDQASGELQQKKVEVVKEGQEEERNKVSQAPAKGTAKDKGKKTSAKKKEPPPTPPPESIPSPPMKESSEEIHLRKLRAKMHKELTAALGHEVQLVKTRIGLVRGCALLSVRSLQRKAEETFSCMDQWLAAHYLSQMNSVDGLAEVVRYHIEMGSLLHSELVLDSNDFYLNGDLRMVASQPPPPRPPPLERPPHSTLSVAQLEFLSTQLYTVAPSGLLSCAEFTSVLQDLISLRVGWAVLPEPWSSMSDAQVTEVVSLLTLESGLVDWRRFLLSAALPWPLPSLAQLLLLLQGFRTADPGATGSVDRDQYLQVELWFPSEKAEPVPEDPTDPLPYNRLANLRKLFFQMFADHSSSPPRLDYARMLGYLAAHPEPGQGVVRALSLALGRTLRHPAACRYVKSMPNINETQEPGSPGQQAEPEGEEAEEEVVPRGSSGCDGVEQGVSVNALLAVLCHRDVHKSAHAPGKTPEELTEDLQRVFGELGYGPQEHVPFSVLCQHPVVQELMEGSNRYQLIDIHGVLKGQESESEPQLSPAS